MFRAVSARINLPKLQTEQVAIYKPVSLMVVVRVFVMFCILGILNPTSAQFSWSTSSVSGSLSDSFIDSTESSSLYFAIISNGLYAQSENSMAVFFYPLTFGFSGTVFYGVSNDDNDENCSKGLLLMAMTLENHLACINQDTLNTIFNRIENGALYELDYSRCHNKPSYIQEEIYDITAERVAFENAIFEAVYSTRNIDAPHTDVPQNESQFPKELLCTSSGVYDSDSKFSSKYPSTFTLETDCKTLFKADAESPSQRQLAYVERDEVIVLGKNADQIKVTNKVQSISKWISIMDSDQVRYCQLANKYQDYELLSEELSQRSLKIKNFLHEFANESWDNSSDYSNNFSILVREESLIKFTYKNKGYSYVHPAGKE